MKKRCSKCEIKKELTEFSKDKTSKDGLQYKCKSCHKEYSKKNKDNENERSKKWREQNKDKVKKWREQNKKHIKEYYSEYQKNRRNTDPLFKMKCYLRTRTWKAFKDNGYPKNTKTQEMLGVDWDVCKAHIERQFIKGMSWGNYGEWHIDHIIPLSSANTKQEIEKLIHYSNLQPLWAEENLSKNDRIDGQQIKFRI